MKLLRIILLLIVCAFSVEAICQIDDHNVLNVDSFPPFVKKVTMNGYLTTETGEQGEPMTSRYYELDSTGKWQVRIETYSDGDESHDTIYWDPVLRTKKIVRANDFEPNTMIISYNKDGTVSSVLAKPEYHDEQLTHYEYDNAGRVIKKRLVFVEHLTVEEMAYDKKGRLTGLKRFSGNLSSKKLMLDYEQKFEYQNQGDDYLIYGFHYGANESIRIRDTTFMMFNESHNLSQKVESMENGTWKKITTYEYDANGRTIHVLEQTVLKGVESTSHVNIEYDSIGYYHFYVSEESSYGYSNRWNTQYNERGLPVQSFHQTEAEVFYYEWIYEYR